MAITAFQSSNRIQDLVGVDAIDVKAMASITPTHPVKLELIEVVQRGDYPTGHTVVTMHHPEAPRATASVKRVCALWISSSN